MKFFDLPLELRWQIYKELLCPGGSASPIPTYIHRSCDLGLKEAWKATGQTILFRQPHSLNTACTQCSEKPLRALAPVQSDLDSIGVPPTLDSKKGLFHGIHGAIVQVCRATHAEALPLLYSRRIFSIATIANHQYRIGRFIPASMGYAQDHWVLLVAFLKAIGENGRKHIRYIQIPLSLDEWSGEHNVTILSYAFGQLAKLLPTTLIQLSVLVHLKTRLKTSRSRVNQPLQNDRLPSFLQPWVEGADVLKEFLLPLARFYHVTDKLQKLKTVAWCGNTMFDYEYLDPRDVEEATCIMEEDFNDQIRLFREDMVQNPPDALDSLEVHECDVYDKLLGELALRSSPLVDTTADLLALEIEAQENGEHKLASNRIKASKVSATITDRQSPRLIERKRIAASSIRRRSKRLAERRRNMRL